MVGNRHRNPASLPGAPVLVSAWLPAHHAYRPARPIAVGRALHLTLPGLRGPTSLALRLNPRAVAATVAVVLALLAAAAAWESHGRFKSLERERARLTHQVQDLHRTNERLTETLVAQRALLDRSAPVSRGERRAFTVLATAYTAGPESTGKSPGHPEYGITFSGKPVQPWHTIAVDPNVIPLGSLVYIPYFADKPNKGVFVAEDTGSAIIGRHVDVYMPDLAEAQRFKRELDVIVLRWGQGRDAQP